MKTRHIIILGLLAAFTACKSPPYVRGESTVRFSHPSSGTFPAEKIAIESAKLRDKIQVLTKDRRSDCFITADNFGYTVVTITKKRLSEKQSEEILQYAAIARDEAWQK